MSQASTVVVVGSVHMDLIATGPRLPRRGESVTGDAFVTTPGGKGGNQASQLALAGCRTYLVGRLGDDAFGQRLREALAAKGVLTDFLFVDRDAATGVSPVLSAGGEYVSMIVPGAAARLTTGDLDAVSSVLTLATTMVLQLELPIEIARYAAALARKHDVRVVLNASPMPDAPRRALADLLPLVDIVIVNRHEATQLGMAAGDGVSPARSAAELRADLGVSMVVVTLGGDGAVAATPDECATQTAFPADVRDTVGAGDAFLGVFVAALGEGASLRACLRRGAAAGSLAVTRTGAHDALPTRAELDAFLAKVRPADLE